MLKSTQNKNQPNHIKENRTLDTVLNYVQENVKN